MAARILPPIVFGFYGASLTTGRYSASWVPRLLAQLPAQPEAVGPIIGHDLGSESDQTSSWGLTNAPTVSVLKPTHILFEGFGAMDAGVVSLPLAATNFEGMVAEWAAAVPGVSLTHQTMHPGPIDDPTAMSLRQSYYDQELALAVSLDVASLDHTPAWPAITALNTFNGDKLHPVWDGAFALYSFPTILAWAREKMAAYWG